MISPLIEAICENYHMKLLIQVNIILINKPVQRIICRMHDASVTSTAHHMSNIRCELLATIDEITV